VPDESTAGAASTALMHDCMRQLALAEAGDEDRLPALLESALGPAESGHEIILVSTRDVDLDDPVRFQQLRHDPQRAAAMRRIRVVEVPGPALGRYFQVE
jgi:hypothetical protein